MLSEQLGHEHVHQTINGLNFAWACVGIRRNLFSAFNCGFSSLKMEDCNATLGWASFEYFSCSLPFKGMTYFVMLRRWGEIYNHAQVHLRVMDCFRARCEHIAMWLPLCRHACFLPVSFSRESSNYVRRSKGGRGGEARLTVWKGFCDLTHRSLAI